MAVRFGFVTSVKQHCAAALFSLTIVTPIVLWAIPASWYFEAYVEVPDHNVGDDPVIEYVRNIYKTQRMGWAAEIKSVSDPSYEYCQGHGVNLYTEAVNSSLPLKLSQYVGVLCGLPAGSYVLDTCWHFRVAFFEKNYCIRSNIFNVEWPQ